MSDDQTRAVDEALERTRLTATPGQPISVEPRDIIIAHADRATLAREVERLQRLSAARPPYRMAEWTPTELAELLLRDREILRAVDAPPPASAPGDGGE